jgi:hypothetical protein
MGLMIILTSLPKMFLSQATSQPWIARVSWRIRAAAWGRPKPSTPTRRAMRSKSMVAREEFRAKFGNFEFEPACLVP